MAAVYKERTLQEAEQQQQLHLCRNVLHNVEEAVSQRESALNSELQFHQNAMMENVSAELAEQRQVLVREAEVALLEERTRLSTVKSEYVQQLTHCQESSQENLRRANDTIHNLQASLHQQERVQLSLNERIQSMQAMYENNDRHLRYEIQQMQNTCDQKLQHAQDKETLAAQEMNLQIQVAESKMNSTIASLRTNLMESQARERYLQDQRQPAEPERPSATRPVMSPISVATPSIHARSPHLPDAQGPPRSFSPRLSFFGQKR